jgi:hypothetical protein
MINGRMKKFINEVTLSGQAFVKDPDTTVGALVKSKGATIKSFVRFEVGEGIEKKEENFADLMVSSITLLSFSGVEKLEAVVIRSASGFPANVWNDDNNSMLVINSLIIFIRRYNQVICSF